MSVDEMLPDAPACIPPIIAPMAAEVVGDIPPVAVPPNWPPLPAIMAAEIEAGKASVPVGRSIWLKGHDPSRFLYPPGPPQSW